jgi:hypothetical protein
LAGLINGIIDLINLIPGVSIEKVSFEKEKYTPLKTTEEVAAEKKVKEDEEKSIQTMAELNDDLKTYSSSILSLADNVDVGVLAQYQEDNKKQRNEWLAYKDEIAAEYGSWEKVPQTIRDSWDAVMTSYDDIDTKFNQAIQSKALGIEGLGPQVARFQHALQTGNTQVAEQLKRDLVNAISEANAKDLLTTQMENIEGFVEKIGEMGLEAKESKQYLEQIAYYMNFKDIDAGVKFVTENFEDLQKALEGDLEAWTNL